jgi:hypothetical protein
MSTTRLDVGSWDVRGVVRAPAFSTTPSSNDKIITSGRFSRRAGNRTKFNL